MTQKEVLRIYDEEYAELYNERFLLGPGFAECTAYETSLLGELLVCRRSWLDVACGTGYFLGQFSGVDRCGLDISSAMLGQARRINPGVAFVESDYRLERPEWRRRWDLVSCMWYAYCYASSVKEIGIIVRNMAMWTAPGGACFLPVCDPEVLAKTVISSHPPADSSDGHLEISAVIWNWIDEPPGRKHIGLVAPLVEYMRNLFVPFFTSVEILRYPIFNADCLAARSAIVAKGRLGS